MQLNHGRICMISSRANFLWLDFTDAVAESAQPIHET